MLVHRNVKYAHSNLHTCRSHITIAKMNIETMPIVHYGEAYELMCEAEALINRAMGALYEK